MAKKKDENGKTLREHCFHHRARENWDPDDRGPCHFVGPSGEPCHMVCPNWKSYTWATGFTDYYKLITSNRKLKHAFVRNETRAIVQCQFNELETPEQVSNMTREEIEKPEEH